MGTGPRLPCILTTVRKNLQNIIDQPVGRNYYYSKYCVREMVFCDGASRQKQRGAGHRRHTANKRSRCAPGDTQAKET
ncbi:hypothetical protein ABTA44_20605, partial [Acinetobacter baumannii]